MRGPTNIHAAYRANDDACEIMTDAYVSHKRGRGPWRSVFSMPISDAIKLRDLLDDVIAKSKAHPTQGDE